MLGSSWMNIAGGSWGPHTGLLSYVKCSYMLPREGQRRWNICSTRAAEVACMTLTPRQTNLPWNW